MVVLWRRGSNGTIGIRGDLLFVRRFTLYRGILARRFTLYEDILAGD
jgi:hypothetical protein